MMAFEVHVWVKNRTRNARYTGIMHELLVLSDSDASAREAALLHYPGEIRKCERRVGPCTIIVHHWKTED